MELSFHDGTVRDMVFMQDTINRSSLLISGGAGDCKIYVTDCETGMPVRAMAGHSGMNFQENKKNLREYLKKSLALKNLFDNLNLFYPFLYKRLINLINVSLFYRTFVTLWYYC